MDSIQRVENKIMIFMHWRLSKDLKIWRFMFPLNSSNIQRLTSNPLKKAVLWFVSLGFQAPMAHSLLLQIINGFFSNAGKQYDYLNWFKSTNQRFKDSRHILLVNRTSLDVNTLHKRCFWFQNHYFSQLHHWCSR